MNSENSYPRFRGNETILFVEDDEAIRSAIGRILEHAGYTVISAATPMEAIEQASDERATIHVLLTDIGLLGVTGPQLARLLLAGRPGLRVLYISGTAEAERMPPGRVGAGTAFLQKPFSVDALLAQLRDLLDRERGPAAAAQ